MDFAYSQRTKDLQDKLTAFMEEFPFDVARGRIVGAPGSWRCLAGESPVRVGRSGRPVASVAGPPATAGAKRTQQSRGVGY